MAEASYLIVTKPKPLEMSFDSIYHQMQVLNFCLPYNSIVRVTAWIRKKGVGNRRETAYRDLASAMKGLDQYSTVSVYGKLRTAGSVFLVWIWRFKHWESGNTVPIWGQETGVLSRLAMPALTLLYLIPFGSSIDWMKASCIKIIFST